VTSVGFTYADPLAESRRLFDAAPATLRVGVAALGGLLRHSPFWPGAPPSSARQALLAA
jgi:hypothetical protein